VGGRHCGGASAAGRNPPVPGNAATREKRDTWVVFLGLEQHTECATLQAATALARTLARQHGRQAWLHDRIGYPLKPIALVMTRDSSGRMDSLRPLPPQEKRALADDPPEGIARLA
jgi:hypothetical protein